MEIPALPKNEIERLQTLSSLGILDSEPEEMFDNITYLAQQLFDVPIALVSLVDEKRQWFKSCAGIDASETSREISFCGHAILETKTFVVENALLDNRFFDNPLVVDEPNIRFYAGNPIKAPNGDLMGTLCIIDTKPRTFDSKQLKQLQKLASLVEREIKMTYLASIDELTGASNRRGFMLIANHELNKSIRLQTAISIIFFDFNNFKYVNDEYGHIAGDRALKEFVSIIHSMLRPSDVLGRMGGDEFAVLLTDTDEQQARTIIQRFQDKFDDVNKNTDREFPISFSHGLVSLVPSAEQTLDDLLDVADSLMFKNKIK